VKLMYAVWAGRVGASDLTDRLRHPALLGRLEVAGVQRIQLNVDDDEVAPALRIARAEPIGAILSVWTDGDAQPVTDALAETGVRVAGWEVDERRPIPPPETPDGARLDGLANVALLQRPDDLPREQWLHNWLVDHTPVAMATQATFGYVQNVVVRPVTDDPPRVDALVEELFPTAAMTDIHAFYGSDGDDAELHDRLTRLMASCARFGADRDLDLVPGSRYLLDLAR
jgi:hypothetical protein